MKKQENQRQNRIYPLLSILITTLILLSLCSTFTLISAVDTQNEIIVENYNISEEYSRKLSDEISRYSELDVSPQKSVSKNVTTVINLYRKELLDLQTHPDVSQRPLSKEAGLAYTKGCSAGKIAWIYFYNLSSLADTGALSNIRTIYEEILSSISSATDSNVLSAKCEIYCSDLNIAMYCELTKALAKGDDSLECTSIIAGSIEKIKSVTSSDIFGKEHHTLYEEAKLLLSLQRARDSLDGDMRSVYSLLNPNGNNQSDQTTALLTYKLKNATSIAEMNASVQSTLEKLLEVSESKQYAYLYACLLKQSISEEIIKANKKSAAADIAPIFIDYTLSKQRADTKDKIYTTIFSGGQIGDKELQKAEAEFNADGGRLDKASSKEEIDSELIRAQYVKQSYSTLLRAQGEIEIILGTYDKTAFQKRARSAYEEALSAILKLTLSSEFEENCKAPLQELEKKISIILKESKAERYLSDHKGIISKPLSEISLDDELNLRNAISGYTSLGKEVQETLLSQINSTVEKYNSLLSQKIRAYAINDTLYLDLCELFLEEIKSIPRNNIDVFYNNCDLILKKAIKLCDIVETYREFCSNDLYGSYNSEEREALVKICRQAASDIHELDIDDKTMFEDDLKDAKESAGIEMQRTEQLVRLRIAARNSQNTQIKAIVADTTARINASFDNAEMSAATDKAIFKINRLLTSDEILVRTEKEKLEIDYLKFLSSEEKDEFKQKINALCVGSRTSVEVAENITVLQFVWDTFDESAKALIKEYWDIDLGRAQKAYVESFEKESQKFAGSLASMLYLSDEESADFSNRASALSSTLKSDILSVQTGKNAEEIFLRSLETLNTLRLNAESANLKNYNASLLEKTAVYKDLKENYSAENYNKLLEQIANLEAALSTSKSISESLALYEGTKQNLLCVNDLLDDAVNSVIKALEERIKALSLNSTFYSPESLKTLEALVVECKDKLSKLSEIAQIPKAQEIGAEYLQKAELVPRDYATSSPNGLSFTAENSRYPAEYDITNGIWGLIYAPNRLSALSNLSISIINANISDIEHQIHRAARKDTISISATPSEDIIKSLKKCRVLFGADITLEDISDIGHSFTLQMLLPNELSAEKVLGLVFIDESGNVEFCPADQRDSLLSVKLSHLSHYYVVAKENTDLLPIIIILAVMAAIEVVVIALMLCSRYQRKRKEKHIMFPLLPCFISPSALAAARKIQPSGAVGAVVLLSVTVLALGCVIALLTKAELRERELIKKSRSKKAQQKNESANILPSKAPAALLNSKSTDFADASIDGYCDTTYYPEKSTVIVKKAPAEDMAEEFEGDVEIVEEPNEEGTHSTSSHYESARHKAEINLDTIEKKFGTNDLVTLDALKRKRLVPKKTDYVKILARGALTKPLVIEAHDFSRAAEEMLNAVGGEAIRIKSNL